ncbi:MAG: SdpI family protein [Clostridia bacterium]|nr:SdpI family protein [Clostridia bacterium]
MGFWFYMLVITLLLPTTLTVIGAIFRKTSPRDINMLVGYRTRRSMLSKKTWVFAHAYCGRIWLYSGLVLLPTVLIAMLCVIGQDTDTVGWVGAALLALPITVIIGSVIATERALKKNFDPWGHPLRRNGEDTAS